MSTATAQRKEVDTDALTEIGRLAVQYVTLRLEMRCAGFTADARESDRVMREIFEAVEELE